ERGALDDLRRDRGAVRGRDHGGGRVQQRAHLAGDARSGARHAARARLHAGGGLQRALGRARAPGPRRAAFRALVRPLARERDGGARGSGDLSDSGGSHDTELCFRARRYAGLRRHERSARAAAYRPAGPDRSIEDEGMMAHGDPSQRDHTQVRAEPARTREPASAPTKPEKPSAAQKNRRRRALSRFVRRGLLVLFAVVVVAGLVVAWMPEPVPVEVGTVTRGTLRVTVDEDGRTRVIDRYSVAAPLSGNLARIDWEP